MVDFKFLESVEDRHEVSAFDIFKVHEHYPLVLRNSIHLNDHWMSEVGHYAYLVEQVALLLALDKLIFALHLHCHDASLFVRKSGFQGLITLRVVAALRSGS